MIGDPGVIFDGNVLGATGRINAEGSKSGVIEGAFQRIAQHLAALGKGGLDHPEKDGV